MSRHERISLREAPRWHVIMACLCSSTDSTEWGLDAPRNDLMCHLPGASGDAAAVGLVSERLRTGEPVVLEAWPTSLGDVEG
jgi:hypothetical protein